MSRLDFWWSVIIGTLGRPVVIGIALVGACILVGWLI